MNYRIQGGGHRAREATLALSGDKSLSHRSLMLAAMADGQSRIRGLSKGKDVASTASCLRALGARIFESEGECSVTGWGANPQEPKGVLDCGNSGTTMRLMSGLLAGSPGLFVLDGDDSLRGRPQKRILEPLGKMGAQIWAREGDRYCPLAIKGGPLESFRGRLQVASAQVKSCLILASLVSQRELDLMEKGASRDHTELMLRSLGVPLKSDGLHITMPGGAKHWAGFDFDVPGDPSSAAFFVAAAVIGEDCRVVIDNVCLNPTRMGFYRILQRMGAKLQIEPLDTRMGETVGRLTAESSVLNGVEVGADEVPSAIDEFPLLAVVASVAKGRTQVRGAEELRVKESDRIATVCTELHKLGVDISETEDGFSLTGPCKLRGSAVECHRDHRLEMSLAIAALVAEGETEIRNAGWASISFPKFWDHYPGQFEVFS